ncbi:MAG: hypothetical protein QXM43_02525 [Desulfurococcaceae archaeon]
MSDKNKLVKAVNKLFAGKNKWIILICIVVVLSTFSMILAYGYFINIGMKEMEDLKMLLNLMEKDIKEAEQPPPGSPPYLSKTEVEKAKDLLKEARGFMERGDRLSAWIKLRELMSLLRKSMLPPPPGGNETYGQELMLRNILLGRLERAKHWLNIFTNLYKKTSDEEVRKLLSNSTKTLRQLIDEAGKLIGNGSYIEAGGKLNEAFKVINETLRSLKTMIRPESCKNLYGTILIYTNEYSRSSS